MWCFFDQLGLAIDIDIDIDKNGLTDFFQMEIIDSVNNKNGYVASQLMTIKDPFNGEAD